MDIYGENVISSDEYDENEDLLNVAVSSANIKMEEPPQTSTITATDSNNDTKRHKKLIRTLGRKLKKKSVKWMQQKFKRDKVRQQYLYSLVRAQAIYKHGPSNSRSQEVTSRKYQDETPITKQIDEPKYTNSESASKQAMPQNVTIDLDDSDDEDDDEDEDDIDDDEDDDGSSSSNEECDSAESETYKDANDTQANELDETLKADAGADIVDYQIINDSPQKKDEKKTEGISANNSMKTVEIKMNEPLEINLNRPMEAEIIVENVAAMPVIAAVTPVPIVAPVTINADSINELPKVNHIAMAHSLENMIVTPAPTPLANSTVHEVTLKQFNDPLPESNINMSMDHHDSILPNAKDSKTTTQTMDITKDLGISQNVFFSEELNAMYASFDAIVSENVHFPETAEIIKKRIKFITADVEELNRALETKEREWNQLLYIKHTKEQLLARMMRKLKCKEVNMLPVDDDEIEAMAKRELGLRQTKGKEPPPKKRKIEGKTAQEIIERGANMSMDEALRLKKQTQLNFDSILEETLKKYELNNTRQITKEPPTNCNKFKRPSTAACFKNLNTKSMPVKQSKLNQEVEFSDFNVPLNLRHINKTQVQQQKASLHGQSLLLSLLNEHENGSGDNNDAEEDTRDVCASNSYPPFELMYNYAAAKLKHDHEQNVRVDNSAYEMIYESKSKSKNSYPISKQSNKPFNNTDETLILHSDEAKYDDNIQVIDYDASSTPFQRNVVGNGTAFASSKAFICQHCGIHKAEFVCADCQDQWYCSRDCQVKAWVTHCQTCK